MTGAVTPEHHRHAEDASAENRGVFDGFDGYRTPQEGDYRSVMTSGMVVLDTNVLLNLYRYSPAARDEFLEVLERLGSSLWIPHQVLREFWRRRESAVRAPLEQAEDAIEKLEVALKSAQDRIRHWTSRTGAPEETRKRMEAKLEAAFAEIEDEIGAGPDEAAIEAARDTNLDPVVRRLEVLLEGRVGPALDDAAYESAVRNAQLRAERRVPPGYKDDKKSTMEEAAGDYLVWEQILVEASAHRRDVLLVTGDVKEDWWRMERGEIRGPRPELALELRNRADCRLLMLRPESFLSHASQILRVDVDQTSVDDVERVDRSEDLKWAAGWTPQALQQLMRRLDVEAPVQANAIRAAAANNGFVSRDKVYELGNYPEARWLNGFTRPVRRITKDLIDSGILNPGASSMLEATYDDPELPFGHAAGFEVPRAVIELFPV